MRLKQVLTILLILLVVNLTFVIQDYNYECNPVEWVNGVVIKDFVISEEVNNCMISTETSNYKSSNMATIDYLEVLIC